MTAVVSPERAKVTCLTAVAGLLILAAAFVMMACAAPSLASPGPHAAVSQAARVSTSALSTESRPPSRAVRVRGYPSPSEAGMTSSWR
jgi:uncharacterized lipoprotein YajG